MEREILQVSKRSKRGKGNARQLRSKQLIPAVLYGKEVDTVSLEVEAKPLKDLLKRIGEENVLIDVEVDGTKHTSLLKEVQQDPVTGETIHIDFHRVSMKEEITVMIPLVVKGAEECPGVQEGGVVTTLLNELEVRCLPLDIPASLELDISGLEMGSTVSVSDISIPAKVELLTAAEQTVVTVARPSEIEVEEPTIGEPEVVGEEGEEGEEGEAKPDGEKAAEKPEAEKKEGEKPAAGDKGGGDDKAPKDAKGGGKGGGDKKK